MPALRWSNFEIFGTPVSAWLEVWLLTGWMYHFKECIIEPRVNDFSEIVNCTLLSDEQCTTGYSCLENVCIQK